MKTKRIVSALLTVMLLLSVLAALPLSGSAATERTVTKNNPVITADVGETVTLSDVRVEGLTGTVTWKLNGTAIDTFAAGGKGVTLLTASAGDVTQNVYFVAKEKNETEYVLYENDFSGTMNDLLAEGWKFGQGNVFSSTSLVNVSNGQLHVGSNANDYVRAILPEWLGDFGNYAITVSASQTNVTDNARWSSIVYRIENANKQYYPYYHMCVRANSNSSNSLEFAERTPSNSWNVIYTANHTANMITGMHTLKVIAYENIVEYLIDGESKLYVSDAKAHTKGMIGLTSNYGTMNVDYIRVTVQSSKPERPSVVAKLIDTSSNRPETGITTYVSNQAYVKPENFDSFIAGSTYPVAAMIDLTGKTVSQADFEKYLSSCKEKNIIPEFRVDTKAQIDTLVKALDATKVPETMIASADEAVVKYARTLRPLLIRAALDFSGLTKSRLSSDELFDLYSKTVGAYAQTIILPADLATKANVKALQLFQISVWAMDTDLSDASDAAWVIASGSNAIISSNWQAVATTMETVFSANNSITRASIITAHRGYSSKYPENSMAAYKGAYEIGADCLETDVHLSKDGVVMISHDDSISRCTDKTGSIAAMTSAELTKIHLKNPNGTLSDETIPTFEQLLQFAQGKNIKILCELKSGQAELPIEVAKLVKKYNMQDQVVYISFNTTQLTRIKAQFPTSTGNLNGSIASIPEGDTAATLNAYYAHQNAMLPLHSNMATTYTNITPEFFRDATDRGMTMFTWTYSLYQTAYSAKNFLHGVDGMTTNDPQYLKDTVDGITAPRYINIKPNGSAKLTVNSTTYLDKVTDVTEKANITALSNDGVVSIAKDGTIRALKDGTATFIASYETELPNGTKFTVYTQTITVNVGDFKDLTLNDDSNVTLENNRVTCLTDKITLKAFKGYFVDSDNITVLDASGKEVTKDTATIGNGYTIVYNQTETKVILKGDLNSNGKIDAPDYFLLKRACLKSTTLNADQTLAGDLNGNKKIDAPDYFMLKKHCLGTLNLFK